MFEYNIYKKILEGLTDNGFLFSLFSQNTEGLKVYVRHDVDIDINNVLKIAEIENSVNVVSTWFFQPNNGIYNMKSDYVCDIIKRLQNNGHSVGLHLDISNCSDLNGIQNLCHSAFDYYDTYKLDRVISFHRPSKEVANSNVVIDGFVNAYEGRFFSDIAYVSDSNRRNFLDEEIFFDAIKNKKDIQFLTHPLWWKEVEFELGDIKKYVLCNYGQNGVDVLKRNIKCFSNL